MYPVSLAYLLYIAAWLEHYCMCSSEKYTIQISLSLTRATHREEAVISNMSGDKREEYSALSEKDEEEEIDTIEEKDNEILKGRISNHPLYDLLVEQHLKCLKVGDISTLEKVKKKIDRQKKAMKKQNLGMFNHSELDHFMEAYCKALGKLKEAMEEPQTESLAFINNMHSQLRDLTSHELTSTSKHSLDDSI